MGIRATGLQAELAAARLALLSAEVRLDQQLAPLALSPAKGLINPCKLELKPSIV